MIPLIALRICERVGDLALRGKDMKSVLLRKATVFIAAFVFCVSLLLPASAVAQGNGRGRGQAKKFQKFVNGHDARAGRWDGRGPRPRLVWTSRRRGLHRGWMIRRHRRQRQGAVCPPSQVAHRCRSACPGATSSCWANPHSLIILAINKPSGSPNCSVYFPCVRRS